MSFSPRPPSAGSSVPADDSITNAKINSAAAIAESKLALASDAAAGTASRRTLGTGATQAAAGTAPAAAVATHEADTTSVHGIADTSVLATASSVATAVSNHEADTTSVHGITDTSALALTSALSVTTANTQTASYTLVLGDAGKAIEMNVASGNTLTVPPNSSVAFPTGTVIEVYQMGAGQVTLTPGAGVTLRERESKLKLAGQYATASLRKRGTDEWVVAGDVAA